MAPTPKAELLAFSVRRLAGMLMAARPRNSTRTAPRASGTMRANAIDSLVGIIIGRHDISRHGIAKLLDAARPLCSLSRSAGPFLPGSSADAGNKSKASGTAGMYAGMPRAVVAGSTVQYCRGANLFRCGPIYNSNDYLGDDPDPFIRLMIQRDLGIKYGGEN